RSGRHAGQPDDRVGTRLVDSFRDTGCIEGRRPGEVSHDPRGAAPRPAGAPPRTQPRCVPRWTDPLYREAAQPGSEVPERSARSKSLGARRVFQQAGDRSLTPDGTLTKMGSNSFLRASR